MCLIPDESGELRQLGFTRAVAVQHNPDLYCVYVPGCPNPVSGRLYFVQKAKVRFLELSTEEAFKYVFVERELCSTGNRAGDGFIGLIIQCSHRRRKFARTNVNRLRIWQFFI